jgi:hypothetical protein
MAGTPTGRTAGASGRSVFARRRKMRVFADEMTSGLARSVGQMAEESLRQSTIFVQTRWGQAFIAAGPDEMEAIRDVAG